MNSHYFVVVCPSHHYPARCMTIIGDCHRMFWRERERIIKAAENLGSIKYRCPCFKPSHAQYTTWDLHIQLTWDQCNQGGWCLKQQSEYDNYSYQLQEVNHIPSCANHCNHTHDAFTVHLLVSS